MAAKRVARSLSCKQPTTCRPFRRLASWGPKLGRGKKTPVFFSEDGLLFGGKERPSTNNIKKATASASGAQEASLIRPRASDVGVRGETSVVPTHRCTACRHITSNNTTYATSTESTPGCQHRSKNGWGMLRLSYWGALDFFRKNPVPAKTVWTVVFGIPGSPWRESPTNKASPPTRRSVSPQHWSPSTALRTRQQLPGTELQIASESTHGFGSKETTEKPTALGWFWGSKTLFEGVNTCQHPFEYKQMLWPASSLIRSQSWNNVVISFFDLALTTARIKCND